MGQGRVVASPQAYARAAGIFYLVIIVLGIWSELFVRAALVVPGDAAATAENILAAPGLFRLSLAADAVMALSDVAVAVLLFALLTPVSPVLAGMAAAFRLVQTSVIAGNLLNQQAALILLEDAGPLSGLGEGARQALALFHTGLHAHGYDLGLVFFGAANLILGWLVARSGFLARAIGLLLAAAGIVYLAGSFLRFLAPAWSAAFEPAYLVPLVAETAFALWLLLRGVDAARWAARRGEGTAAPPERG